MFPNVLSLQPSGFFKKRQREAGQKDKRVEGREVKEKAKLKINAGTLVRRRSRAWSSILPE